MGPLIVRQGTQLPLPHVDSANLQPIGTRHLHTPRTGHPAQGHCPGAAISAAGMAHGGLFLNKTVVINSMTGVPAESVIHHPSPLEIGGERTQPHFTTPEIGDARQCRHRDGPNGASDDVLSTVLGPHFQVVQGKAMTCIGARARQPMIIILEKVPTNAK